MPLKIKNQSLVPDQHFGVDQSQLSMGDADNELSVWTMERTRYQS